MGNPNDGRPSGRRETLKPVIRPRSKQESLPDTRITITGRNPPTVARIVAFGSWLLVFMLLLALLKGINERRIDKLKDEARAVPPQPVASVAGEIPQPAPPAEEPGPVATLAAPVEIVPAVASPPLPAEEPEKRKPAPPKIAQLTLTPSENGNFFVKGEINRQDVVFVVDTGASAVSIPDKLRWKLGLTRGRYIQSATANGIAGMYETQVKDLSVGPLRFKDVQAVLYPNAPNDVVLLGMTALRDVRMEQQNGRMVLQQVIAPEEETASPGAPPRKLTKSVKECMGADKVVNDRVLKCMQGEE